MKILKNKDKLTSRLKRTSDAFGNFLVLDSVYITIVIINNN